MRQYNKKS